MYYLCPHERSPLSLSLSLGNQHSLAYTFLCGLVSRGTACVPGRSGLSELSVCPGHAQFIIYSLFKLFFNMKKFISFAAFALLATMSLSFVSCSDDDEPALPEVPTTLAEAKAMLIGQWRTPDAFLPTFADEGILEFGKDGRVIRIFKIKKNLPMSPSLKRLDDPY